MDYELFSKIQNGEYQNIIICSGAGVSTRSGIPDYRSEKGIFADIKREYPNCDPTDVFTRYFRSQNPEFVKTKLWSEFLESIESAEPTASHRLCVWLNDRGWLKRVYTQNIDRLYRKAGLPSEKLVEFHGAIDEEDSVVLYGDPISQSALSQLEKDFTMQSQCDLIVVMGTSLQVQPFCAIPNLVSASCTRVLVNKNPMTCYTNPWSKVKSLGYYNSTNPVIKIGKRKVSLRPHWNSANSRCKWKDQYIFTSDCDEWSETVMSCD